MADAAGGTRRFRDSKWPPRISTSLYRTVGTGISGNEWDEGLEEVGRRSDTGAVVLRIDQRYFRPAEAETACDPLTPARNWAGACPQLEELVREMISVDQEEARKEAYLKRKGFQDWAKRVTSMTLKLIYPNDRFFVAGARHGRKCIVRAPSATVTATQSRVESY